MLEMLEMEPELSIGYNEQRGAVTAKFWQHLLSLNGAIESVLPASEITAQGRQVL